jgi:hypothetical protein
MGGHVPFSLRGDLEYLQETDVSKMSGQELREFRDKILNIKWLILACDPRTRVQIQANMDRDPERAAKRLTMDEFATFVPEPPTVRFL